MADVIWWGRGAGTVDVAGFFAFDVPEISVNWGDGQTDTGITDENDGLPGDGSIFASHSWAQDGVYNVTVWDQNEAVIEQLRAYVSAKDPDGTTVSASSRDDAVVTGDGADVVSGRDGDDMIVMNGGNDKGGGNVGDDYLGGDAGSDTLKGGTGYDYLDGGVDRDFLYGDEGDDKLFGSLGADVLRGGDGSDLFVFAGTGESPADAPDKIADFQDGADRIGLFMEFFDGSAPLSFRGEGHFTGDAGEVRYKVGHGSTFVLVDTDGDRHADLRIQITGEFQLDGGDFSFDAQEFFRF